MGIKTPKRIAFDFSHDSAEKLKQMVGKTNSKDMAEVIRKALSVLDIVIEASDKGEDVVIKHKSGKETKVLVF